MFEVVPAIDLSEGRVVRLMQGDRRRATVYGDDPLAVAHRWVADGARRLHLVDLDAAWGLQSPIFDVLRALRGAGASLQVGGGIHDAEAARARLAAGASDLVIGSVLAEPRKLADLVEAVGADRLIAAIDVRQGELRVAGWLEAAMIDPFEALAGARSLGIRRFIVTAVERDGTEEGPDLALLRQFAGTDAQVWASGGVGSLQDLQALSSLGLAGAIVGRALYEGRFHLAQAMSMGPC